MPTSDTLAMHATLADRDILRNLADRYRAHCEAPRNQGLIRRWYDHNALNQGQPLVVSDPEGAWIELIPESTLEVGDPTLRGAERWLRQKLYTIEVLQDDQGHEGAFPVSWKVNHGHFGVEVVKHHGDDRGSWKSEPPIKDLKKDLALLRHRQPQVDRAATAAEQARMEAIFGDLLPVVRGPWLWWTDGITIDVIDLIGLDRLMMAMMDEPDELHALMAWMRDEHLAYTKWLAREELLHPKNGAQTVGSGGMGFTRELPGKDHVAGAPYRLCDIWGFSESQETVGVGPKEFAEFILPYQMPIISQYGLTQYGCCEGLERRIDLILSIPRLRRVSVSPWAKEEVMAAKLGNRVIYSRKPLPTLVCCGFNEATIRADLRKTLAIAKDCQLEFILKDTHTVENQPWRLARWVAIAHEEIDAFMAAGRRPLSTNSL